MERWLAFLGIVALFGALSWVLASMMRRTKGGSINPGQYGRGRHITAAPIVRDAPKPPHARKHH